LTVKFQVLRRSVAAVLVAAAPLGGAAAQQTDQRGIGQQEQQEQPQGQQHPQPHPNPPPPAHVAPPPAPTPQVQHPAQNPPPQFQRPAQTGGPPNTGAQNAPPHNPGPQNVGPQNAGSQNPGQQGRSAQFQQRGTQPGTAAQTAPRAPAGGQPPRGNPQPAPARNFTEHHGGAAPEQFDRGHFYGHDFAHFTPHEVDLWHEGRWHQEFHDGRYGWWYDVDGIWYFYPQPVYPYPTFVPDVVYIPEVEAAPPPVAVNPAPPPYYYYYCDDAQAYYPYVTSCDTPWRPVPPTPQ
jgi:hypothetical protein